jgi:hypothetical protein
VSEKRNAHIILIRKGSDVWGDLVAGGMMTMMMMMMMIIIIIIF